MSKVIKQANNWKKNIGYLLSSQAISMAGTMLVQYAIIWHVTLSTKSGAMVGIMTSVGILPMVLVMPFAGALADHYNRKTIAILADASVALISLVAAIMIAVSPAMANNMILLIGITIIRSFGQGFQTPAIVSIIPQLTPEKQLMRVNGIEQTIQAAMMLVTPALAAGLLAILPLSAILLIDFLTATIGVSALFFLIKIPTATQQTHKKIQIIKEIKGGIRYLQANKILLFLVGAGFLGGVLTTPAANLAPLQLTRNFNQGLWQLSTVEIGFAVGMLTGGTVMSIWGGFKNRIKTLVLAYTLMAIPLMMLGLTANFWVYFSMMVVIGLIVPMSRTAMVSFFQTHTDDQHMGRVMSIVTMSIMSAAPLTMLVLGPLSDITNIDYIMIASGILMVPLALWLLFSNKFKS